MTQSPKRLLLLDDDYESMAPLKTFLEAVHGFDVTLTASATLLAQLGKEKFDLICLDLMIHPVSLDANDQEVINLHFADVNWQKTGLAFLERLRSGVFSSAPAQSSTDSVADTRSELCLDGCMNSPKADATGTSPQVPVIILSAVADRSREERLLRNDKQTAYLEKPFDLEEIVMLIEKLL